MQKRFYIIILGAVDTVGQRNDFGQCDRAVRVESAFTISVDGTLHQAHGIDRGYIGSKPAGNVGEGFFRKGIDGLEVIKAAFTRRKRAEAERCCQA